MNRGGWFTRLDTSRQAGSTVSKQIQWRLGELSDWPQVGRQVGVGLLDGLEGGLSKVAQRTGGTGGRGVAILNARHVQQLLGHGSRNDASTTWSGDQSDQNGTTLAGHLKIRNV